MLIVTWSFQSLWAFQCHKRERYRILIITSRVLREEGANFNVCVYVCSWWMPLSRLLLNVRMKKRCSIKQIDVIRLINFHCYCVDFEWILIMNKIVPYFPWKLNHKRHFALKAHHQNLWWWVRLWWKSVQISQNFHILLLPQPHTC